MTLSIVVTVVSLLIKIMQDGMVMMSIVKIVSMRDMIIVSGQMITTHMKTWLWYNHKKYMCGETMRM